MERVFEKNFTILILLILLISGCNSNVENQEVNPAPVEPVEEIEKEFSYEDNLDESLQELDELGEI